MKTNVDDSQRDFNIQGQSTPFTDSVSCIEWMPPQQPNQNPPNMFAATTWDGTLRIYEVTPTGQGVTGVTGTIVQKMCIKVSSPILNCCWNSDTNTSISLACADGFVRCADLTSGSVVQLGKHNDVVHNVFYVPSKNAILSIGYDKTIHFWQRGNPSPLFTYNCPDKIYVSDFANNTLVVGTSQQKIMIFNMENFGSPSTVDSLLQKYSQLQCIRLSQSAELVSYGSIDGRGNICKIVKNINGYTLSNELIFKANKLESGNNNMFYPVNSIGFNQKNIKWLFTASADGVLQFWNYDGRGSIKIFNNKGTPITTAKVSYSGDFIAYATGNDWHLGPEGHGKWPVKISVHYIPDAQVKFAWKQPK